MLRSTVRPLRCRETSGAQRLLLSPVVLFCLVRDYWLLPVRFVGGWLSNHSFSTCMLQKKSPVKDYFLTGLFRTCFAELGIYTAGIYTAEPKARSISVFSSISWAFAEPVAGDALS